MTTTEQQRLEQASQHFSTFGGAEGAVVQFGYESIEPWLHGDTCLELGPADGLLTDQLRKHFDAVVSVDGSETFAKELREKFGEPGNHRIVVSLFEEYEPPHKFDSIVAARILEHVDDPVALYRLIAGWLEPGGSLIVQVPNALSFHRLLGVEMGQLQEPHQLNEQDKLVGHRRVYDMQMMTNELQEAGWEVVETNGTFFKLFANGQMDSWFDPDLMNALNKLGSRFPENAAVISARCQLPDNS